MTAPLTLAEVQALAGFTEGPWMPFRWTLDSIETVAAEVAQAARNSGGTDLHAAIKFVNDEWIYPAFTGNGPTSGPNAALVSAAPALHATCLHLFAEVARLTAELGKPVASAWGRGLGGYVRWANDGRVAAAAGGESEWNAYHNRANIASGPETGDAGKRAADLALVAAGYRLVGGVFGEVSDG